MSFFSICIIVGFTDDKIKVVNVGISNLLTVLRMISNVVTLLETGTISASKIFYFELRLKVAHFIYVDSYRQG